MLHYAVNPKRRHSGAGTSCIFRQWASWTTTVALTLSRPKNILQPVPGSRTTSLRRPEWQPTVESNFPWRTLECIHIDHVVTVVVSSFAVLVCLVCPLLLIALFSNSKTYPEHPHKPRLRMEDIMSLTVHVSNEKLTVKIVTWRPSVRTKEKEHINRFTKQMPKINKLELI
jgi:hypothetical protein